MQNTQQSISAEFVTNMIWHNMNQVRGNFSMGEIFTSVLAVMYAVHKGYHVRVHGSRQIEFETNDDTLFHDLIGNILNIDAVRMTLCNIYTELDRHIGAEQFNSIYVDVLKGLFDLVSINSSLRNGDFYTPRAITKLMAGIVQKESCTSVYDPFCGTASFVHELSNVHFEGQELSPYTALYARINLEAACATDEGISVCDSTQVWSSNHFDALVSCPPFGMRFSPEQLRIMENLNPNYACRSIEDMLFTLPFSQNGALISVVLTTTGFCFRGNGDYELRKHLIEQNLLDTIICLPTNIMYSTSIRPVIIVCKTNRSSDEPIKIIHAEDYFIGEYRKRVFDVDRCLAMMDSFGKDCVKVSVDEIRDYEYNLNPSLYYNWSFELNDGQKVIRLGDLITCVDGERVPCCDVQEACTSSTLSKNFIEILLNNSRTSLKSEIRRNMNCRHFAASDKKYLLSLSTPSDTKYGLFTDKKSFDCTVDIRVFEVNTTLVTPEYLVYALTNNEAINKGRISLSEFMMLPIVIDTPDNQKRLVDKIVQRYQAQTTAELEADAKRLGVKQNISDLEHMLGTTQNRIGKIIQRLEKATPDATNYQQLVKQLKDNVEYMNRTIQYTNARIESASFNMQEGNISAFIKGYADAWNNYGSKCFALDVLDELDEKLSISFDKGMLTVMLDSILNNAVRHGFHKRKKDGNQVLIRLSEVAFENSPYLVLSIANNGEAIADGFTIQDYVSRGRYTDSTGRSGLGGYHVFQIVKGHNGYLRLDSNKQWNVMVEVLLPTNSTSINDLPSYENECI